MHLVIEIVDLSDKVSILDTRILTPESNTMSLLHCISFDKQRMNWKNRIWGIDR